MADAATEIADAVGLSFFFYSAHAVATETALVSVTAADAVLTTDAIQSSGFYLFFAAVAAVASIRKNSKTFTLLNDNI
mgnify:CR=1 FL=1